MRHLLKLSLCIFLFSQAICAQNSITYLFIGSFTNNVPDTGLYVYEFNSNTGALKFKSSIQQITNPSYLAISPNGRYVYACTDSRLPNNGNITAFVFDSIGGTLKLINKQSSGGDNPVFTAVHQSNKFVVVGNYNGGSVSVFTTNSDGSINPSIQNIQFIDSSINIKRQEKSHVHSTVFSPQNDYVFLPDLGSDKIRALKFDVNSRNPLQTCDSLVVKTTPGSGPRHFTFHPNQKFAYCIEEMSGMVTAYSYKAGKLDFFQQVFSNSKIQEEYSSADIHISPDGLFLYTSNRIDNTISIFSVDRTNGKLKLIGHQSTLGDHPRNFTIDPSGNFLLVANMLTNNIVVFRRNLSTGLLTKTKTEIHVPNPSCLQMNTYGNP